MDLTYFNQYNLYHSLHQFFDDANIPVTYLTETPTIAQDILTTTYNPNNPAHQLMRDVYFLGMVDDAVFQQNASGVTTQDLKTRDYEGLLIFGVTLNRNGKLPTRTQMADITRAFNREFHYTPVVNVFKYDRYLSFATCERLPYIQTWREGEKTGKVSILKDVDPERPHTGHLRILENLKIQRTGKQAITSFAALYTYWQEVFSVSLLNKRFYRELSNWYFWALQHVEFPDDAEKDNAVRNATNVIRLITRLIFVWFLKEKQLIPEALFDKTTLDEYLKYEDVTGSTYYKAILQNLFFATLNTEMRKDHPTSRQFVNRRYGVQSFYRYSRFFQDKENALDLFKKIPFLNGGLFENLDKNVGQPDEIRIDCFSDRRDNEIRLKVPDFLFFGDEDEIDLSQVYGDKKRKHEKVRGVINILNSYKFTITENTPIEEEIALDPELLGKVFENLLASYNPETQTTARKQTGSFYTPREIVNYMVDESLIAYLANHLTPALSEREGGNLTPALSKGEGGSLTPALFEGEGDDLTLVPSPKERGTLPPLRGGLGRGFEPRFFHTTPENWKILKEFARDNRKNPTEAENILWQNLRNKRLGYRFRRQHAIGDFIVDFVCIERKLVVEVDGDVHERQQEYDEARTNILNQYGFRVIRFWNTEVETNLQEVLRKIREALEEPHPQPLPKGEGSTPPSVGGGLGGRFSPSSSEISGVESSSPFPSEMSGVESSSPSPLGRAGVGLEQRLRHLLSYSEEPHQFNDEEVEILINALNTAKILDPTCGSGAFPMGILHKMVHILSKLDPDNARWKHRQIETQTRSIKEDIAYAEQIRDDDAREKALAELHEKLATIDQAFGENELDYGRKLYLIENCIYGVDIQPIAGQIAKLRCFISLIVDQKVNPEKKNLGILPLPNLETKFVAANTLIGIEKPAQMMLRNPEIDKKEAELKEVREKHFSARTPRTKERWRKEDERLREEISELLQKDGFPSETTEKLAHWNPYDQNASAAFFDPEWMFGITGGFGIIIGNPPYVQIQKFDGVQKERWKRQHFQTYTSTGDVYCLFYEKGNSLLTSNGILCYISSNKWMRANYGKSMRKYFRENACILQLIDFGDAPIFESATTYTNILLLQKAEQAITPKVFDLSQKIDLQLSLEENLKTFDTCKDHFTEQAYLIIDKQDFAIKQKIERSGTPLKDWNISINYGIKTGYNEAFIINGKKKRELIAADQKNAEIIKPILSGRDIKKYVAYFDDLWLIFTRHRIDIDQYPVIKQYLQQYKVRLEPKPKTYKGKWPGRKPGSYKWYEIQDNIAYYREFEKEKIVYGESSKDFKAYYDKQGYFLNKTLFFIVGEQLKYLTAFLNSRLFSFAYKDNFPDLQGDSRSFTSDILLKLPIKKPKDGEFVKFETLVDQIEEAKQQDPNADTSDLEQQIDLMIYKLYDLTYDEVKIVEPEFAMSKEEYDKV